MPMDAIWSLVQKTPIEWLPCVLLAALGVWAFFHFRKKIQDLEDRIDRGEWDWNDLKRLKPELFEKFPPR